MKSLKFKILAVSVLVVSYFAVVACSVSSDGFFYPVTGFNEGRILVLNSVTSPVAYTAVMYDLDGNFIQIVADTSAAAMVLRGLALFDPSNVIVSTDNPDELWKLNLLSGILEPYATNAQFAGNIYDTVRQAEGTYLTIETSTIEKFVNGVRVPASGATPYIAATNGACTISTARGLTINSLGDLIVTSYANSRILRYDVSTSTASCLTSEASFGANQPVPVVAHPDGNIYFGTLANDAIYSQPEDLSSAPSIILSSNANINNPMAMAVLPNGHLLVASDGIDSIVEITTSGTVINSNFIHNAFTGTVSAILVLPPQ